MPLTPFVTENSQMLGDIALRRSHGIDDLLDTSFLIPQDAKNFQAQRMRNRLEGTRRKLNMLLLVDQVNRNNFV